MRVPILVAGCLIFLIATNTRATSQTRMDLTDATTADYDPDIPTPKEVLGYQIGDRFTPHHMMVAFLQHIAESSDRVRMMQYGTTFEGRPLEVLIITSPDNQQHLDSIRRDILSLADPRKVSAGEEVSRILDRTPAIAWLSYGVHGNESSSSEAAMQVVYQLAASGGDTTHTILDSLVVVIDPLLNPDGRERYVNWYLGRLGAHANGDPQSIEHHEPWPGGRTNHYFFDLNRDWAWLSQKETKARLALYRRWMPQVHVDYHEMSPESSYFFFPATRPINPSLPPNVGKWAEIYGRANAAAFDRVGWSYYTREVFDLFYPGYGDSWPSLNGAVGMTYEQAGGGAAGLEVRREDGTSLSLRDRVRHHYLTSMTTLYVTAERRRERLADFREFWVEAIEHGRAQKEKTYVIVPGSDPANATHLVNVLRSEGIEVQRTSKPLRVSRLHLLTGEAVASRSFDAGTYLVFTAQPANHLLTALFDLDPAVSDTLFYDITAWCLPVAFGVETYWAEIQLEAGNEIISETLRPHGEVKGDTTMVAFLIPWQNTLAASMAYGLLQRGYKVTVATKPFRVAGQSFDRGTLIVPALQARKSRSDLLATLRELSESLGIAVYSTSTGWTEEGIDLGSDRARTLRLPKLAVVADEPVWSSAYGAIWYILDQEWNLPFAGLRAGDLASPDLAKYNVVILPDDGRNGDGYQGRLDSVAVARLKSWVGRGGVLIGIRGGASFLTADRSNLTSVKLKGEPLESEMDEVAKKKVAAEQLRRQHLTWEEKERERRRQQAPGALLQVRLDNTHPLGFGFSTSVPVLVRGKTTFELTDKGHNVGYFEEHPGLAGYLSQKNMDKLAGSGYLMVERLGQGRVVLVAEDPTFRAFLRGLWRVLANAIFFGDIS